jgi:hypothetical protein
MLTIAYVNRVWVKTALSCVSGEDVLGQHIIAVYARDERAGRSVQSLVDCIALARVPLR